MQNGRRDQFEHFAPRTTRCFVEFSPERLSPDVFHRRLVDAKVVGTEPVEVAVFAAQKVEVRHGDYAERVEIVDDWPHGAHEPVPVTTEQNVSSHHFAVVQPGEVRKRVPDGRLQLEDSNKDANAELLFVSLTWGGQLLPSGVDQLTFLLS